MRVKNTQLTIKFSEQELSKINQVWKELIHRVPESEILSRSEVVRLVVNHGLENPIEILELWAKRALRK